MKKGEKRVSISSDRWAWAVGSSLVIAASACGSEVIVDGPVDDDAPPVIGGGNGPQPASGGGGSTGTATTSTTTTTGTGGSSGKLCGVGQPPCPPSEFCDFPGETCGPQGTCSAQPGGCPEDCPGVCGCDGEFYCNGCMAQASGVDVSDDDGCVD